MTITEADLRSRTQKLLADAHPDEADQFTFRGAQFDAGLAMVHFPEGLGGLGLSRKMQAVVTAEIQQNATTWYEDMAINPMGIGMAAPTLLTYGTREWHERLFRPLYTGEEMWCQMFSEPGAGSDVAALATRAERDGDEWILNGQKVWTSLAHIARWGLIVTRSDPEVAKHKGLTYFFVDMHADGVEVRPLHQISGEAEFNEVFFTDARVPDEQRLGDVGDGWRVAITTLMNERSSLGGGTTGRTGPIDGLLGLWSSGSNDHLTEAGRQVMQDEIMKLWIRSRLHKLTSQRAKANAKQGNPGPEASVLKLAQAELHKEIWDVAMHLLGPEALTYEAGFERRRPERERLRGVPNAKKMFLRSQAHTIEGGTSDIMRNILGERVLGLPGDVRTDKELPWSEVPRGV